MKRVLLITVSSDEIKRIRHVRYIKFQQCTMPYLAAIFPSDWEVVHVDEEAQPIDYKNHYDLVGLTFHTPCCHHAYDIARKFRDKGIMVIMGGHTSRWFPMRRNDMLTVYLWARQKIRCQDSCGIMSGER